MESYSLKIRIDLGKVTAMGPGKAELLEHIIETGSISAAAKSMQMSYRRAWELVDTMNQCFSEPVVLTSAGGAHGGGAVVTEFGQTILATYRTIISKTLDVVENEISMIASHLNKS